MAVPVRYALRETGSNLFRNRMMALAAVLTVAVSLSLVGASLLLKQAVATQVGRWSNNVSLQIFEAAGASKAQHATLVSLTNSTPEITHCNYLDHQQSYLLAKQLFAGDPQVWQALTPAMTPPVFECVLQHPNDAQTVAAIFAGKPGVFHVAWPAQSIRVMQEVTGIIQKILLVVAVILLGSSLVLILNAIRMAIFARRREVGVMKLVGATNWFIRVPFMLEGLVQGLIGSVVAAGILLLGNALFRDFVREHVTALNQAVVPSNQLILTEILVIVVGTIVGALGSGIAVRRYLDV